MIKNLLFLIIAVVTFNLVNAQMTEHIEKGKQAYLKNANKANHEKINSSKDVTAYIVGDTKVFWRWNLSIMPPQWIQEAATCRAVGDNSYVFIADSQWGSSMTQQDVDTVMRYLEDVTLADTSQGIVDMDIQYFGVVPDELDNDPKVIFYYSALGSYGGSTFDGYFSAFNQLTESEAQMTGDHSNECEMLYMSCNPVDPTSYSTLSVLSHELEHLIHFGADPYENTWVDEGCAEFAMVLFGYPDPLSNFPSNPDDNLTVWDQQFSDYVQTMLFFTYLSEQTIGPVFITNLVSNAATGVNGINNALANISYPLNFQEILSNWTMANYIDDSSMGTQYNYEAFNMPIFSTSQYFGSFPASHTNTLNACAADYFRINNSFTSLQFDFDFTNGGEWDINLIAYENAEVKEIIPINTTTTTDFDLPSTYTLTKLILVVTNKEVSTVETSYSFTISNITNVNNADINNNNFNVYPQPANYILNFSYTSLDNSDLNIDIIDISGKNVLSFSYNDVGNNFNKSIDISDMPKGVYIIKASTVNIQFDKKLIVD